MQTQEIYQLANLFEKSTACLDFQTLRESAEQKRRMGETNEAEISRVLGYV